jgi:zinc transport system substrate-binding protein
MTILKLMDMVEVVEEEIVEGMEHEEDDHEEDGHSPVLDEHVWTSPRNAKVIVAAITEALCELDGDKAEFYRQNAAEYLASLDGLDASFRAVGEGAQRKTVIFGDRFPFRYLTDAYGLSYFAAFPGCSTDTEPSASTVAFLINKVKSEQVPVVFHIELSNEKMADTISEAAGVKKLLLHSCHNVTRRDFESGANYLDIQKANVENLKEALW